MCQYRNHSHADHKSVISLSKLGEKKPVQSLMQAIIGCWISCTYGYLGDGQYTQPPYKTPCDIRLIFSSDERGMPTIAYKLSLQIRNQTARDIAGVSVYWLDGKSAIVGNSAASCGVKDVAVAPSESGPCETIVQQVGGALLQRLGQATWTKIINDQLANFRKVEQCAIIGYNYRDHKQNTD